MLQSDYIAIYHNENQKITTTRLIDLNIRLKTVKDSIHTLRMEYENSSEKYDAFQKKISEERLTLNTQQQNLQDSRIKLLEIEKEREGLNYRIETFTAQETEITARIKKYNSEFYLNK